MWQLLHRMLLHFSESGFLFGIKCLHTIVNVGRVVASYENRSLYTAIEYARPHVVDYLLSLPDVYNFAFEQDGGRALDQYLTRYPNHEIDALLERHFHNFENNPIRQLDKRILTIRVSSCDSFRQLINILSSVPSFIDSNEVEDLEFYFSRVKNLHFCYYADSAALDAAGIRREFGIREIFLKFVREKYEKIRKKYPYVESNFKMDPNDVNWGSAEQYFQEHPESMKDERKKGTQLHSVINVNHGAFALQAGCIGEGGWSRVKKAIDSTGRVYAIKIYRMMDSSIEENTKRSNQINREILTLQTLKRFGGVRTRSFGSSQKTYIVTRYMPGKELHDYLYHGQRLYKRQLDGHTKILLALKAAQSLFAIHQRGVVHCDVKVENFKAHFSKSKGYRVNIYDFGFSQILKNAAFVEDYKRGSGLYHAPEFSIDINEGKVRYSIASDIYALGKMFQYDFELPLGDAFYAKILAEKPEDRMQWPEIFDTLNMALESTPTPDARLRF